MHNSILHKPDGIGTAIWRFTVVPLTNDGASNPTAPANWSRRAQIIYTGEKEYWRVYQVDGSGNIDWGDWVETPKRSEITALNSRLSVQGVGDMDDETIESLVPKILEKMARNGTVYLFQGPWTNRSNGYSCIAFRIAYSDNVNRYTGLVVSYDAHAWLFTANSTTLSNPVIITLA